MPQVCSICAHRKRADIERALLTLPLRDIERRFQVNKTSLWRHKRHAAAVLARSAEAREMAHGSALAREIRNLIAEAHRLRRKAERGQDIRTAIKGLDTALKAIELFGRVSGELTDRRVNVNVNVDVPSLGEGIAIAEQLLLDGMTAEQLRAFIAKARTRLDEQLALLPGPVIEAAESEIRTPQPPGAVGTTPNGPP